MRFILSLSHASWRRDGGRDETLALVRRADEGGIDSVWLTEDPDGWDAFAVLGALSQHTTRIRLGTGVVNPYHRYPNLMSASITTLDRLAPGRVVLGLGRGQPEWYERALGMETGSPLEHLRETILLLRQWEESGTASIDGDFHVHHWTRTLPAQHRTPIYLAAAGPKALDLAGELADGVFFNMLATPAYLSGAIARVRKSALEAGRDPNELEFIANPNARVTDDPAAALRGLKRFVATILSLPGMDVLLENPTLDVSAIMQSVREAMKIDEILARGGAFSDFAKEGDLDTAIAAIPDAMVEYGSAVGSLDHVRERIAQFEMAGITSLALDRNGLPNDAKGICSLIDALNA